jgi:polar amino acid transport system substrate-binding protein
MRTGWPRSVHLGIARSLARASRRIACGIAAGALLLSSAGVLAQATAPVFVPGFWDPKRRPDKPEPGRVTSIRYLTEEDYPPFNFKGPDGHPIGFNVDLARAICAELTLQCTIQVRRFDTLVSSLEEGKGDAIIASLAINPETRKRLDFTDRYYRSPARFIARKDVAAIAATPEQIAGKKVAVVQGTAHEAYLRAFFAEAAIQPMAYLETAFGALKRGEVDLVFADGIALAFWLNGRDSAGCCTFRGGAFTESRFFGEGVGIAVRKGNGTLRRALDYALFRLWEKGVYTDLYLRYFPVGFY